MRPSWSFKLAMTSLYADVQIQLQKATVLPEAVLSSSKAAQPAIFSNLQRVLRGLPKVGAERIPFEAQRSRTRTSRLTVPAASSTNTGTVLVAEAVVHRPDVWRARFNRSERK